MNKFLYSAFEYLLTPARRVDWIWKSAVLGLFSTGITMLMYVVIDLQLPMSVPAFYLFVTAISLPFFLLGMKIAGRNAALQEELARMALSDMLTGLSNRRAFFKKASEGRGCILMMDVDRFKAVNDAFGHDIGDSVLQKIARHLETCVRSGDHVARLCGDEFEVLLMDAESREARGIGDRIDKGVTMAPVGSVTLSVGAVVPQDWKGDLTVALKRADDALYSAKKNGRACVVFWSAESVAA